MIFLPYLHCMEYLFGEREYFRYLHVVVIDIYSYSFQGCHQNNLFLLIFYSSNFWTFTYLNYSWAKDDSLLGAVQSIEFKGTNQSFTEESFVFMTFQQGFARDYEITGTWELYENYFISNLLFVPIVSYSCQTYLPEEVLSWKLAL